MALNINTLQLSAFKGTGEIVISANQRPDEQASVKSAGIFHKIKMAFGFASAKAANKATIDAIRTAIMNDKRLFMAAGTADRLLGEVRGTITADKVQSILATLTAEVNGLVDSSNGTQTETNFKNAAVQGLKGRIAGQDAPKFLRKLGLDKDKAFMKWYVGVASESAVKSVYGNALAALRTELDGLNKELRGLQAEVSKLRDKLKNATDEGERADLQVKIEAKENEISDKKAEVEGKKDSIRAKAKEAELGWTAASFKPSLDATNKLLKQCLDIFANNREHLRAFVNMITEPNAKVLDTGGKVTADPAKTLRKAQEAKALFEKADALGSEFGTISKSLIMAQLRNLGATFPADMLAGLVKAGRSMEMTGLKCIHGNSSKKAIKEAIDEFIAEANEKVNGFLNGPLGEAVGGGMDMIKPLQKIALHCAIAALPQESQEDIYDALDSANGDALRKEWSEELGDMHAEVVDIISEPLELSVGKKLSEIAM